MTDRRTDGRAIAYTRYSIYAVARKNADADDDADDADDDDDDDGVAVEDQRSIAYVIHYVITLRHNIRAIDLDVLIQFTE